MIFRSLSLLLGCCFVQALSLSNPPIPPRWIHNILEDFRPQIANISFEIQAQISAVDFIIKETSEGLQYSQSVAKTEIENAIFVLELSVNQIIEDAENPKYLQSCFDQEKVAQTNLESEAYAQLEECVQTSQNLAAAIGKEIKALKSNLLRLQCNTNLIIRECVRHNFLPWQQSALRRCLSYRVDAAERKLILQKIIAKRIRQKSQELLHELTACRISIDKDITSNSLTALEEFRTCVQSLISTTPDSPETTDDEFTITEEYSATTEPQTSEEESQGTSEEDSSDEESSSSDESSDEESSSSEDSDSDESESTSSESEDDSDENRIL